MGKWLKRGFLLALAASLIWGISYLGARTTVGKLLGSPAPSLGTRTIRFLWAGAETLPGRPRVWQFTFSKVAVLNGGRAVVYVSPTGKVLRTVPGDLENRIAAARKAKEDNP